MLSPTIVFTEFTLTKHESHRFSIIEQGIDKIDEISECHLFSDGYDYLVKLFCASVAYYQKVVEWNLGYDLGIERYFSCIVIKSPISNHKIKLDQLVKE